MVKVIIHGCNGKMGKEVVKIISDMNDVDVVAGIDKHIKENATFPIFEKLSDCDIIADVVIDFSNATAIDDLIDSCVEKKLPIVLCTTNLSDEQIEHIKIATKTIPILKSANMSLGINVMQKIASMMAKILYNEGFDIEIIEKHHNMKVDAPSGTAILLANSVNEALNNSLNYVYDRSKINHKRDKKEIGISSIRAGGIVGEHELIFASDKEMISLKHEAFDRSVFAKGAVVAALFLVKVKAGLYSMSDIIGN